MYYDTIGVICVVYKLVMLTCGFLGGWEMEYSIKGNNGYIRIIISKVLGFPDRTTYTGGYDCIGKVIIKSDNFYADGELWFSTGEIYDLNANIKKCYKNLEGIIDFNSTENNLDFQIKFDNFGKFTIIGFYKEKEDNENELKFEIHSDQSYLKESIKLGDEIEKKFGGNTGLNQ